MVDKTDKLQLARVKDTRKLSVVWAIPAIAFLIGSWMIYYTWMNQGPLVTISFETAEGVEINNTKIKLRDVTIGKVVELKLNDEFNRVVLTARLKNNTESLLKKDTDFWVVKPRVGRAGVSGLSTLVSGAYIELSPGQSNEESYEFEGLETPPVTPSGTPGLHITLDSSGQRAFDIGDPIFFRGIRVGQIEYVHFNFEERRVYYNAFIEGPYDELITTNTRFWEINGFEFDVSADGIKFQSGTLETMIGGGVAFDVPSNLTRGEVIRERAYFSIYPDKKDIYQRQYKISQNFILQFAHSIRGLKPGAPVEYKGVRVGTVLRTDIDYPEMKSLLDRKTLIPVLVKIEPGRLGLKDKKTEVSVINQKLEYWVTQGLHGVLSTGNLLTGSKYVDLRYLKDTENQKQKFNGVQVIPTAASEIERLSEKFGSILSSIDKLPLDKMVDNANVALKEIDTAMRRFASASIRVDQLLDNEDSQFLVRNVNETLKSFELLARGFSDGSKTHAEIQQLITDMNAVFRELKPVLSQLNLQPNSLIFGGERETDVEPEGKASE